jgi:hypothetical protein
MFHGVLFFTVVLCSGRNDPGRAASHPKPPASSDKAGRGKDGTDGARIGIFMYRMISNVYVFPDGNLRFFSGFATPRREIPSVFPTSRGLQQYLPTGNNGRKKEGRATAHDFIDPIPDSSIARIIGYNLSRCYLLRWLFPCVCRRRKQTSGKHRATKPSKAIIGQKPERDRETTGDG